MLFRFNRHEGMGALTEMGARMCKEAAYRFFVFDGEKVQRLIGGMINHPEESLNRLMSGRNESAGSCNFANSLGMTFWGG
jgi:hypothetical protein